MNGGDKRMRYRIASTLLALAFILTGVGCLSRGPKVSLHHYLLKDEFGATAPAPAVRPSAIGLGLRPFDAASFIEQRMLYRISPVEIEYNDYEVWAEPPQEMVSRVFLEGLRSAGLFKRVAWAEDFPVDFFPMVLTGRLERFELDRTTEPPSAYIAVSLELRGSERDTYHWEGMMTARENLTLDVPAEYARATERALRRLIEDTAKELSTHIILKK